MTARSPLMRRPFPDASDFQMREDDYSIQIIHPDEPFFWLRLEKEPSDVVRISDLQGAKFTEERIAVALEQAIKKLGSELLPAALLFLDVLPTASGADAAQSAVHSKAVYLTKIVVFYAQKRNLKVDRVEFFQRRNKHDVRFALTAAQSSHSLP